MITKIAKREITKEEVLNTLLFLNEMNLNVNYPLTQHRTFRAVGRKYGIPNSVIYFSTNIGYFKKIKGGVFPVFKSNVENFEPFHARELIEKCRANTCKNYKKNNNIRTIKLEFPNEIAKVKKKPKERKKKFTTSGVYLVDTLSTKNDKHKPKQTKHISILWGAIKITY